MKAGMLNPYTLQKKPTNPIICRLKCFYLLQVILTIDDKYNISFKFNGTHRTMHVATHVLSALFFNANFSVFHIVLPPYFIYIYNLYVLYV